MLITEPPAGRCGIAAFVTRKGPVRLASMTSLHSSSGYSSIPTLGPSRPALLTSTSILPKRPAVSLIILWTSEAFDTSAARARTSAPVSSTSAATGPMDSSLRALIATLAPSLAKASASALPRPWLSAAKARTRPRSSACPVFGTSSLRSVIRPNSSLAPGPASRQLLPNLPRCFPQERDVPQEILHRMPERQGRHAQRGHRAVVVADHRHAYRPDPLFVFLVVRRVSALPGQEGLLAQPFCVRDGARGQPLQTET